MTGHGGRRDQARRDAITVEIGYALCSAAFAAGLLFAAVAGPAFVFDLSGTARSTLVGTGATLAAVLFVARVVSVLVRFEGAPRLEGESRFEGESLGGSQPSQPGRTNPDS
ncbi:DUF6332 family protein [Streptomyces viridochromogenes]|uniref:Uncharacterized protein n=1 Tax=Streptomyces viridochromogenes Tue57 TaxID=1160705 RepID=L8P500_STRVR|nr:DUF6332 family protein [Streptomyces viridochromogenes]ELS51259.1 hypothetical protein STVIR_7782 [Streptomyces viridochromogenes Tue57]